MNKKDKRFWAEQFVGIMRIYWGLHFFVRTAEFISYLFCTMCCTLVTRNANTRQTNKRELQDESEGVIQQRSQSPPFRSSDRPTDQPTRSTGFMALRRENTFALPSGLLPFVFCLSLSLRPAKRKALAVSVGKEVKGPLSISNWYRIVWQ